MRWIAVAVAMIGAMAVWAGERGSQEEGQRDAKAKLRVGDMAPNFELITLESIAPSGKTVIAETRTAEPKQKTMLSSLHGEKAVVLLLSSYS